MTDRQGFAADTAGLLPAIAAFYLDVHRHPELSGREERTAGRFADWLGAAGYEVRRGIGGHGVAGVLRNGPGPVVLVRAELDALPVTEDTGLPYASTVPGVMHACGHDAHLACAAGAARLLAAGADRWRGTLVVVGQPAEETLSGAEAMLTDGLYDAVPVPDIALAQHTVPLPAGMVAHADGPALAAGTTLEVVLHGRGGHAGAPHLAVDPVVTAAATILRLQTVVSRESAPGDPVVVTVGAVHAGGPGNVIPDRATLEVTVRAFSDPSLDRALAAVRRIVTAESAASGEERPPGIRVLSRSTVTASHPDVTETLRRAHEREFGPHRVTRWQPSPATEDFPLLGSCGAHLHGHHGIRTGYWMLGAVGPRQWAAALGGGGADGGGAGRTAGGARKGAGGVTAGGADRRTPDARPGAAKAAPGPSPAERLAALPGNHSPHFAPHVRLTLETGTAALAVAARAHLAPPPGSVKVASRPPSGGEG
ncbi:amidohydrolase [Actinacidiphila acididurans]|uniref:amidohydrolase n=1 Tax=Actinacidiphila acididurans TaxID=2784346 RepID=UPI003558CFB6